MAASTRRCKANGTMPEVSAKSSEFRSKRMRRLLRHAALGGDIADEALHPFRQGDVGGMAARQIVGGGGKRFDLAPIDHLDQMLARGEVPVEGADPDAGPPCDLLQGGIDAMLGKDGGGDLQQPVAIAARIGAQLLGRGRGRGLFAFGQGFDGRQWNSQ